MIITRKVQLIPVPLEGETKEECNSRCYSWVREFCFVQAQMMNDYIRELWITNTKKMDLEDKKEINRIYNRLPGSKKGSAYGKNRKLPKGLGVSFGNRVRTDFGNALSDMYKGQKSLPTYKKDFPILIPGIYSKLQINGTGNGGLYHLYKSDDELANGLISDKNPEIYYQFCNNMTFRIVLGSKRKSYILRQELYKIFSEEWKLGYFQMKIKDNKLYLYMPFKFEEGNSEKNKSKAVVAGVSIGYDSVATMTLLDNECSRYTYFNIDSYETKSERLREQRIKIQRESAYNHGGNGRKRKLEVAKKKANMQGTWQKTLFHSISKQIINKAVESGVTLIVLEDMKNKGKVKQEENNTTIPYFDLQTMIDYKARKHNIGVVYVKEKEKEKCCYCGEIGKRVGKAFICSNENCKSKKLWKPNKNYPEGFSYGLHIARRLVNPYY